MKKKIASTLGLTSAVVISLAACGGGAETYEYDVSGTVNQRQIDYDCPDNLSMDNVGFSARTSGGSGSRSSSSGGSSSSKGGSKKSSSGGSSGGTSGKTSGSSKSNHGTSGGVKLKKKPRKPMKVLGAIAAPMFVTGDAPSGCEIEYELYVVSGGDTYEQDVRQEDYENCTETEAFPACTEGS